MGQLLDHHVGRGSAGFKNREILMVQGSGIRASCLQFLEPHLLESEVAALQEKFC